MNIATKQSVPPRTRSLSRAGLALAVASIGIGQMQAQPSSTQTNLKSPKVTTEGKFYCNTKALNPTERTQHKALTDKLVANRKGIIETEKGYEFQFGPSTVSVAELAQWVANESKCCPFFDFHIDLERGQLVVAKIDRRRRNKGIYSGRVSGSVEVRPVAVWPCRSQDQGSPHAASRVRQRLRATRVQMASTIPNGHAPWRKP